MILMRNDLVPLKDDKYTIRWNIPLIYAPENFEETELRQVISEALDAYVFVNTKGIQKVDVGFSPKL